VEAPNITLFHAILNRVGKVSISSSLLKQSWKILFPQIMALIIKIKVLR